MDELKVMWSRLKERLINFTTSHHEHNTQWLYIFMFWNSFIKSLKIAPLLYAASQQMKISVLFELPDAWLQLCSHWDFALFVFSCGNILAHCFVMRTETHILSKCIWIELSSFPSTPQALPSECFQHKMTSSDLWHSPGYAYALPAVCVIVTGLDLLKNLENTNPSMFVNDNTM